ncbi:hypothetical protein TNIN_294511 [Trichonephila inaurata madagascariensis]|uniref:Uncharacterized protein n=1 Tax=Trichonephila inaurata madagascariensis TaxID=2747483 RepID=A0A8X7BYQ5_9ARAC|nr:hypothetical protein TNIN_294511 [Trichonephila inaurata madagascariensis]
MPHSILFPEVEIGNHYRSEKKTGKDQARVFNFYVRWSRITSVTPNKFSSGELEQTRYHLHSKFSNLRKLKCSVISVDFI